MPENYKLKVFLGHSKDDKQKVREYYYHLIADGFDAWLDEERVVPGQDWDTEIRKAIRGTDVFIVFLSKNSVTKEGYIQKEVRMALDIADEKPEGTNYFIPARLEECAVPSRIGRFQWVNLFDQEGYKKLKDALEFRRKDLNIRFTFEEIKSETKNSILVPILGSVSNGLRKQVEKEHKALEIARSLLPNRDRDAKLYALEVKGDSMIDSMIYDNDIVIMEHATNAKNGEMVAVRIGEEFTLRYFFRENNGYKLQPANPEFSPIYIPKGEAIEINGKVVMVIRKQVLL